MSTAVTRPVDMQFSLETGWTIVRSKGQEAVQIDFPGDVHSALLAAGLIEDPYWRDREMQLDWVHESEWVAERTFEFPDHEGGRYTLTLEGVDCHAVVSLNGREVGFCSNRYLRYDFDVTEVLRTGNNALSIRFHSNSAVAAEKAASFPFPVPYIEWNNRIPHYNFLRKPQCDAGWDWNIALSPIGVHGGIVLRRTDPVRLDDVLVRQHHSDGRVRVDVDLIVEAVESVVTTARLSLGGQSVERTAWLWPGEDRVTLSVTLDNPRLWWPVGHGEQAMYQLDVAVGGEARRLRVGLRDVELVTDADDIGNRFAFRINGREIFVRGANWIPADALPARATRENVADLLDSAVAANMNMIRVWGGGTYEPDWFYEMCSERGLMVWQDFMFACNLYPAADWDWLEGVREEARQQIRRLSAHPCLALWCGDNELVGALNWFEESRVDRDRYLAMYDRLNHALEEAMRDEASGLPFWPSSPSVGPLNFGDGWHDDTSGDMHFWDVWHEAKDFEHYRTVRPRFCSEFGFQSFPSPRLIESFTTESDRNVSSNVMEAHQRNVGGNSRIVETLARYFRFPDGFEDTIWLSQVGQALAMKTAIEFWRANKPRCMGTLYWQLNDTWPVASWASLEYGGGWKITHYLARRFYAPVLVTAQPDADSGEIVLWAVNDTPGSLSLNVHARSVNAAGGMEVIGDYAATCPTGRAVEIARVPSAMIAENAFLHLEWSDITGRHCGENEYLPKRPKDYVFGDARIEVRESVAEDGVPEVELTSDLPALFVTWDLGGDRIWSDNCLTLLPGRPRVLHVVRDRHSHLPEMRPRVWALKG